MKQVSTIEVTNKGAYVFNYSVQWLDDKGNWQTSQWSSGNYPVLQTVTSPELSTLGVPDGAIVTPYGHAVLGSSGQGHGFVQYSNSSKDRATYFAEGTTIIGFDIALQG